MRRRERFAGVAWLRQMEEDEADGRVGRVSEGRGSLASNIAYLVHDLGGFVELEKHLDSYRVRILPRTLVGGDTSLPCAASYSGVNLASIVATAAQELLLIKMGKVLWRASSREHIRWVA